MPIVGGRAGGYGARHLTLVAAPELSEDDVRAALDGVRPLAVLPAGPPAVVAAARVALRPDEPLEPGADLVVVTSGSTGTGRAVLLPAAALRASGGRSSLQGHWPALRNTGHTWRAGRCRTAFVRAN